MRSKSQSENIPYEKGWGRRTANMPYQPGKSFSGHTPVIILVTGCIHAINWHIN
ncbi:hypothetical protein EPIR_3344 [Erwinia piriflorinigrans CFBP 5888]|uniref:Uncharacterized protein n=1 Tax=Erwinia piriflorinigrans CFBP 5888 TaxID=1161919 RepID=V5ZCE4_9GAMM|nr:hypothetical protein EPIR_3344 [Erwinia piriflorinigrans CFBP 5888]